MESLELTEENAVFPEWGQFAVALGAAMYAEENGNAMTYDTLLTRVKESACLLYTSDAADD